MAFSWLGWLNLNREHHRSHMRRRGDAVWVVVIAWAVVMWVLAAGGIGVGLAGRWVMKWMIVSAVMWVLA